jgi:hypothetical protein
MFLRYVLPIAIVTALLSGCATAPYVIPEGASFANLKNTISGTQNYRESIDIGIVDPEKKIPARLFYIYKSTSKPEGYVKVPANEPLQLYYDETASGGRSCKITIQVRLEEGKNYVLVGGFTYKSGPIPILMGTRGCEFGLIDEETKLPVPVRRPETHLP